MPQWVGSSARIRFRAAAVLLRDGAVLLHRMEGDSFWALPGGKVEPGESAADALARELFEELAAGIVVGPLICVAENFFVHKAVAEHEVGLIFSAQAMPDSCLARDPGPYVGVEGGRRLESAWFAPQSLARVDLRPAFWKGFLCSPTPAVRHVVHRG